MTAQVLRHVVPCSRLAGVGADDRFHAWLSRKSAAADVVVEFSNGLPM